MVGHCFAAEFITAAWLLDKGESSAKASLTSHPKTLNRTTLIPSAGLNFCKNLFICVSFRQPIGYGTSQTQNIRHKLHNKFSQPIHRIILPIIVHDSMNDSHPKTSNDPIAHRLQFLNSPIEHDLLRLC